ncbi:MAG: ABC transporter ATP-binding protein [Hyphomicrobiaceae bacterium]|nr:ABC transporter ATP-binding protein [Hyphomicrobiaceae bacterium]
MTAPVLEADGVGISFGGVRAVDNVSFRAYPGRVLSIIGPNGAGKTTLFNLVSGVYRSDSGRIRVNGVDATGARPARLAQLGLSRTFQNLQIFGRMTALENVMVGRHLRERHNVVLHLLGVAGGEHATREASEALLDRIGLLSHAHEEASSLSYGVLKRLEIARALATEPKVLLLDEPAAGCNAVETAEIDELLIALAKSGLAIVLVEHDMKLVMSLSDSVLVLDQGRSLVEGPPNDVARDPRVIAAYLGVAAEGDLAGGRMPGGTHAAT